LRNKELNSKFGKMLKRKITQKVLELLEKFPIVAITGPRQSGKTTLSKIVKPNYKYVNLENFTLSGKEMKSIRAIRNKLDRENFVFTLHEAPYSPQFLKELKVVSDDWLGGRKEKGFSLGFFDEDYVSLTPVAVTRNKEGKLVSFMTLMPVYDERYTLSVDLMRYSSSAPSGVMDYMFINLFEYAQEKGYKKFNLGMAPLSNVGVSKYAFLGEKIASQFYSQGHFFYHFQGVRRFKDKYADEWEPKYPAKKKKSSLLSCRLFTVVFLVVLNLIQDENKSLSKIQREQSRALEQASDSETPAKVSDL